VFRIAHAGNLSQERDPTALFRALATFAARHPDTHFEFEIIGGMDAGFEAAAKALGVGHMLRRRSGLPYLACLERLANADLQVMVEAPCEQGVFLPSKLTDYVEVGRPILAISPRVGVVRELIDACGFGVAATCDVEAEIEAALETCFVERDSAGLGHRRSAAMEEIREAVRPGRILADLLEVAAQARELAKGRDG
jgi:glycosyltransferase involved in cell wall biosynthesis